MSGRGGIVATAETRARKRHRANLPQLPDDVLDAMDREDDCPRIDAALAALYGEQLPEFQRLIAETIDGQECDGWTPPAMWRSVRRRGGTRR